MSWPRRIGALNDDRQAVPYSPCPVSLAIPAFPCESDSIHGGGRYGWDSLCVCADNTIAGRMRCYLSLRPRAIGRVASGVPRFPLHGDCQCRCGNGSHLCGALRNLTVGDRSGVARRTDVQEVGGDDHSTTIGRLCNRGRPDNGGWRLPLGASTMDTCSSASPVMSPGGLCGRSPRKVTVRAADPSHK